MLTQEYTKEKVSKHKTVGCRSYSSYLDNDRYNDFIEIKPVKSSFYNKEIAFYSFPKLVSYIYQNETIANVPKVLEYLITTVKKSESILFLENDFDDNGSEKYDFKTWKAAVVFLFDYADILYSNYNTLIDIPKIYNAPKGSIDLFWENEKYTLLINIDKKGKSATFYTGNSKGTQQIRGEFKLDNHMVQLLPFPTNMI